MKLRTSASDLKSVVLSAKAFAIYYLSMAMTVSAAFMNDAPGGLKKTRIGGDRMIVSMLFSRQRCEVAPIKTSCYKVRKVMSLATNRLE